MIMVIPNGNNGEMRINNGDSFSTADILGFRCSNFKRLRVSVYSMK